MPIQVVKTRSASGTSQDDFFLVNGPGDFTIYGGGGNDRVWNAPTLWKVTPGASPGTSVDIDNVNAWLLQDSDNILKATSVPHLSFLFQPAQAGFMYYKIHIKAGETITLDTDSLSDNKAGLDTELMIYDPSFATRVAYNDDGTSGDPSEPDWPGTGVTDSFLSYTAPATGTYYVVIGNNGWFDGDEEFLLHISHTDRPIRGVTWSNNIVAYGGDGNDHMSGTPGPDTMYGGSDHDRMTLGKGNDSASGGDGNDTIWTGSGNDTARGWKGNDKIFWAGVTTTAKGMRATIRSSAGRATTRSMADRATTRCLAETATTRSRADQATTVPLAVRATTESPAIPATTICAAGRATTGSLSRTAPTR
ncbi:Hemolysin, chromosomal [Roseisalinus antarcticus]|uniref:Hemolysin, chromosomal n=1 Tax=Roseisalinus antarcticus TaxID=254357 RepID=A0A1Y5THH4_9RHOB|nr:Hemolysin, chromosomal [Roseisalinus antarcticus]